MELITAKRILVVSPLEAYPTCDESAVFVHACAHRAIHIGRNRYHLSIYRDNWHLDALQIYMFDIWYRVVDDYPIKYGTHRIRFGPWVFADEYITYESDTVEHVVKFHLSADRYHDEIIHSINGQFSYNAAPRDFKAIIAITMALRGSQYLY